MLYGVPPFFFPSCTLGAYSIYPFAPDGTWDGYALSGGVVFWDGMVFECVVCVCVCGFLGRFALQEWREGEF